MGPRAQQPNRALFPAWFKRYKSRRIKELTDIYPGFSSKEIRIFCREEWNLLPMEKKLPWKKEAKIFKDSNESSNRKKRKLLDQKSPFAFAASGKGRKKNSDDLRSTDMDTVNRWILSNRTSLTTEAKSSCSKIMASSFNCEQDLEAEKENSPSFSNCHPTTVYLGKQGSETSTGPNAKTVYFQPDKDQSSLCALNCFSKSRSAFVIFALERCPDLEKPFVPDSTPHLYLNLVSEWQNMPETEKDRFVLKEIVDKLLDDVQYRDIRMNQTADCKSLNSRKQSFAILNGNGSGIAQGLPKSGVDSKALYSVKDKKLATSCQVETFPSLLVQN